MNPLIRLPAAGMCALVMVLGVQLPHQAQAAENAQAIVDKAALTVEDIFSAGDSKSSLEGDLATARAVMVCPSMFQMSIAFGGGHGNCVLLARDARGSFDYHFRVQRRFLPYAVTARLRWLIAGRRRMKA